MTPSRLYASPCASLIRTGYFGRYDAMGSVTRLQTGHRYALPKPLRSSSSYAQRLAKGAYTMFLLVKQLAIHGLLLGVYLSVFAFRFLQVLSTPRLRYPVCTEVRVGGCDVRRRRLHLSWKLRQN